MPTRAVVTSLVICALAAVVEGALAGGGVKQRFAELRLPSFSPPLGIWVRVFGPASSLSFPMAHSSSPWPVCFSGSIPSGQGSCCRISCTLLTRPGGRTGYGASMTTPFRRDPPNDATCSSSRARVHRFGVRKPGAPGPVRAAVPGRLAGPARHDRRRRERVPSRLRGPGRRHRVVLRSRIGSSSMAFTRTCGPTVHFRWLDRRTRHEHRSLGKTGSVHLHHARRGGSRGAHCAGSPA